MKAGNVLFTISWVLLLVVLVLIALGSFGSLAVAFGGAPIGLGALQPEQLSGLLGDDNMKALRGQRTTAATWALAYAIIGAWIVLLPYRKGARWAWWALFISLGLSQLFSVARIIFVGTTAGSSTSAIILAFLLLGLLAGVPRMFMTKPEPVGL
jgi:hypothetical protein